VSTDSVIRAPYVTQWLGLPYYIGMPAITTVADGRTFLAMGHIAHHEREEPWLNTLLARNGYNGMELWRKRLPDGYLVHRSAFIATADTFFMIDPLGEGCLLLDPETGADKGKIRAEGVEGQWKWIALVDGVLYALAGRQEDPAETTVVRSVYPAWSWGELSKGYYEHPKVPWGFGETLLAYDLKRDKVLWTHSESALIDSRALTMGEGRLYFYAPDARLGCLDTKSGDVVWSNESEEVRALIEESGKGLGSTPGFRSACFCIYTPKGLFYEAQTRQNIVAVNKDNGDLMWHRGKSTNNPNVIYLDGNILVGIGEQEGSTLVLDPTTGETIEDLGFKKRSCVRLTATPDSLFCRGWPEGLTRYDRDAKQILFDGSVRPSCNDGVIGANGLLYMGPWLCDCNLTLMGTVSLCSAGDAVFEATPCADRLERTAVDTSKPPAMLVSSKDWYAYRGGNAHAGSSIAEVSRPLHPVWMWRPQGGFEPTAPVAACGSIFFAGDDGVVRALDAGTGHLKWMYQTAGRILQPPTIWGGNAYVGSEDGYVYALDAETGGLVWRFRAAPTDRRIMVYGRLASTWPANSGVIVNDGIAYVAAGSVDHDGTYVDALDARTGEVQWENTSSGHVDPRLRKGVSAQGSLTVMGDSLWMAGGNVISPAVYRLDSGEYTGPKVDDGSPRANRGEEIGVFRDKYLVFGGRLRYSATENVVNPGNFVVNGPKRTLPLARGKVVPAWDDGLMVATPERLAPPVAYAADAVVEALEKNRVVKNLPAPLWSATALADSQIQGLALAADGVVVLCRTPAPRQLAPRWRICLLDRDKGNVRWDHQLPGAVRPDGLAIDRDGRVLVTLADGSLHCFGGRRIVQAYMTDLIDNAAGDPAQKAHAVRLIQETLRTVPDAEGRALLMAGLDKLGVDACQAAKDSGSVYLWQLLGPVPWDDQNPMDKALVNEPDVKIDQPCRIANETLEWSSYVTLDANGMVDLAAIYGPLENRAAYAYAELEFSEAQDILLKIGSNDGFKCWFNGKEAGRFDGGRTYFPDQNTLEVRADAGRNRLLLKISQQGGGWALGARCTDPQGVPATFNCVKL